MTRDRTTPPSTDDPPPAPRKTGDGTSGMAREARLKAALKANMARRKAQAKARSGRDHASETADNKE